MPVDELGGDEVRAICLANFMDGDDVWMIERGSSLCFADKAAQSIFVIGILCGQQLERDFAIELRIAGKINLAHPTFAQRPDNFIVAD